MTELDVSGNEITDIGAQHLARMLQNTKVVVAIVLISKPKFILQTLKSLILGIDPRNEQKYGMLPLDRRRSRTQSRPVVPALFELYLH